MSLSRTISEINRDFSQKLPIFLIPMYLAPLLKGFRLEFGTDARGKNRMMGLPDRQNNFTIGLAI